MCNLDNDQPSKNSDSPDIDNILLDGNLNMNQQGFIKTLAIPPKFDKSDNDYKTSKSPIGEESFDEISFWNIYHIIKCPADGHCFVHVIVQSFNSVITSENHINETMLLYLIQSHTEMNAHLYVSCFESKHALLQQMKRYIFDKIYLSLFGDSVVFIAASALNVVNVVIEMKNDKLTKTEIKSRESDCNSKRLYVFKTGEHYDAIVPETRPISGNDKINVALAANDKDTVKSFQNPLGFYAAEMEIKSSDNDVLNNSPGFCNFIDIGMCTEGAQVMLQDYSNMHTNVTHDCYSLHSYAMINFHNFIDIYEYLDD